MKYIMKFCIFLIFLFYFAINIYACDPVCYNVGSTRCVGNLQQQCQTVGSCNVWIDVGYPGACKTSYSCVEGDLRCNVNNIQTCNTSGNFVNTTLCQNGCATSFYGNMTGGPQCINNFQSNFSSVLQDIISMYKINYSSFSHVDVNITYDTPSYMFNTLYAQGSDNIIIKSGPATYNNIIALLSENIWYVKGNYNANYNFNQQVSGEKFIVKNKTGVNVVVIDNAGSIYLIEDANHVNFSDLNLYHFIFVSDQFIFPTLPTTTSAINTICQNQAVSKGFSGTWYALINNDEYGQEYINQADKINDILTHYTTPYYTLSEISQNVIILNKVADNWNDLTDGSIDAPISTFGGIIYSYGTTGFNVLSGLTLGFPTSSNQFLNSGIVNTNTLYACSSNDSLPWGASNPSLLYTYGKNTSITDKSWIGGSTFQSNCIFGSSPSVRVYCIQN